MIDSVSAEQVAYFRSRVNRGQSIASVSRQYGIAYGRLSRWLRLYDKFGSEFFPPTEESMEDSQSHNEELKAFAVSTGLNRAELADLLGISSETVKNWMRSPSSPNYRKMPKYALELLKLKVEKGSSEKLSATGSD